MKKKSKNYRRLKLTWNFFAKFSLNSDNIDVFILQLFIKEAFFYNFNNYTFIFNPVPIGSGGISVRGFHKFWGKGGKMSSNPFSVGLPSPGSSVLKAAFKASFSAASFCELAIASFSDILTASSDSLFFFSSRAWSSIAVCYF